MTATEVRLDHVRAAAAARDPLVVDLLVRLVAADLARPRQATGQLNANANDPNAVVPPTEPGGEPGDSFDRFFEEIRSREFRKRPRAEQQLIRRQRLDELRQRCPDDATGDRYRSHEVITELWQRGDSFGRDCLLRIIDEIPLAFGPIKALKAIFKDAEQNNDTVILGALAARFDEAIDRLGGHHAADVACSPRTLAYLVRRAWRYLRRTGQTLPAVYPDTAVDFLCRYRTGHDAGSLQKSWIFNHIFFHQTGSYGGTRFLFGTYRKHKMIRRPSDWVKHRAFADAWGRSPRPLFDLLQRGRCEIVRTAAIEALKADFRGSLREVDAAWVARLMGTGSGAVDEFAVWMLQNVPKFERANFKALGLHDAVLRLLDSPSAAAAGYAAQYVLDHATDLPTEVVIRLVAGDHRSVRDAAMRLIGGRDARRDVGLEGWGRLLELPAATAMATEALGKYFTAKELTANWLADRVVSDNREAQGFAIDRLPRLHPVAKLGTGFFVDLLTRIDPEASSAHRAGKFVLDQVAAVGPEKLDTTQADKLLLHPVTRGGVTHWVDDGKLAAKSLGAEFLKRIAFHPTWGDEPLIAAAGEWMPAAPLVYNDASITRRAHMARRRAVVHSR